MGTREYLDFDLQIESSEHGYRARVINSPVGQATTEFDLPLSEMEVENFILKLNRPRRGVRRIESQQMEAAKEIGGILYSSVFQGQVSSLLQSSLVEADKSQSGLRIRLRLSDTPELLDLPWEYMYNRSLNRFLSLSVDSPLVRYLDMPGHIPPLEVKPPLRVLVMISSPQDVPTLDTEEEWRKLKESVADLEKQGLMVLDRLEKPTLGALQRALRRKDYHIFHFIGHGGFDEVNQDGILLLEDEQQRSRQVSGQDLGIMLHDEKTLRLAVLNSCEGGRTSRTDPFVGVGQSLLQQGIPAVIAMQFEISDEAAIKMSHEFYYALADGYPVDASLAEARKGIFAEVNDVEWGTPVLYLRSSDGRIFDVDRKATIALPRTEVAPSNGTSMDAPSATPAVAGATAAALEAREPVRSAAAPAAMPQPVDTGYATATPAVQSQSVSTGLTRTASPAAATPAPAPQAAGGKGGAGGRTKLWLGLGALLAVVIIGGGIFLFGGLGGSPDGNLPEKSAESSVALPVGGDTEETATAVANNTPTTEPTIVPTDEPVEVAVVAEEQSTTDSAIVEPTLEPTDTPEPTLEPTDTPEPTRMPTDTPEPTIAPVQDVKGSSWPLVLLETFDSNANDWSTGSDDDEFSYTEYDITDGKLREYVKAHQDMWAGNGPDAEPVTDFYLSVEAQQLSGPDYADYGLMFRQLDGDNFYYFGIGDNQVVAFERVYNGEWTDLIDPERSVAVRPGEVNKITVVAEGSHLSYFVNDYFLAEVEDDQLASGLVAVAVNLYNAGDEAVFEFDNFELRALDSAVAENSPSPAEPTNTPKPVVTGPDYSGRLAVPLLRDFEPVVYLTGLDGKGVNTKGVEGLPGSQPMFSRDGKTLILNGTGERVGLISANAQGTESRVLLDQDSALWPILSPDSAVVSYVDTSVNDTIYKLGGDGSRSEVKANGTPVIGAKNLLWSDDNRLVFQGCAFWAGQAGECGTYVTDANNVNPKRIIVGNSAWPSDAKKGLLAYMSAEDGDWDIFVVSLNGGEPRNVTANNAQDGLPAIAPDGKSLAYLSNQSGTWAVWTVNLSNGEKKKWFDIDSQAGTVNGDTWYTDRMSWTK